MGESASHTVRAPRHGAIGGGAVFVAALTVVNGCNFLFHLTVSRQLGPSDYGALGPLLGVLVVLAVPAGALQVAITKKVAARRRPSAGQQVPVVIGPLLASSVLWGIGASAALIAASPLLKVFLHLPSVTPAMMVGASVLPMAIGLVPKAVLLGELRYRLVGAALVAGTLVRLGSGVLLLEAGRGLTGAMAASVIGEVVTAALLLPALRSFLISATGKPILLRWHEASTALVAFTGFWLLTAVHTVLARHFLPGRPSGFYAAASTAASAAMFLPGAVALVAFPRFAETEAGTPAAKQRLVPALIGVGATSALAAVAVAAFPQFVITVLFGKLYLGSTVIVGILSISYACLAVTSVLMHYHLATEFRAASAAPWVGVVLAIVGVSFLHSTLNSIALVTFFSTASVLVIMTYGAFAPSRTRANIPADQADDLWRIDQPELDLTIVVPSYNSGARLVENLGQLAAVLRASRTPFEVIAVSDGSTDGSEKALTALQIPEVRSVILPHNFGKGQALRVGLSAGRGRYLGFIDADGDLAPTLLNPFLAIMRLYEPDVVLGSKRHPMSEVHYPLLRRIYSWGYQQLVRLLFRLNVRDTQTGLKVARREVWAAVLPRMLEKRFAFDLEFFVVARRLGYRRLFEAPVRIERQFGSTVSAGAVWGTLLDTLAIFYRLRVLRFYDEAPTTTPKDISGLPANSGR